jgi:DNA polymerase III subunit epsilon
VNGWLERLLGRAPVALRAARWVVIDCETTGLDPRRDRLLSVAAVALRSGRIVPAESFAVTLRGASQDAPDNVLVHGIGADAQREGRAPREALGEFAAFLGEGLPVAFHAPFDAAVLARAMEAQPGLRAPAPWLDVARLVAALHPRAGRTLHALDDWLDAFGIEIERRHDALHDAFATAQLFQMLLARAEHEGVRDVRALRRIEHAGRWLQAS